MDFFFTRFPREGEPGSGGRFLVLFSCAQWCSQRSRPPRSGLPRATCIWQYMSCSCVYEGFGKNHIILMIIPGASDGGFQRVFTVISHSVRLDVSAHFSALDGQQSLVVEGSGVAGTPGV